MSQAKDFLLDQGVGQVSPEHVRHALQQIVSSTQFQASPRLQQFLTYIVEETLAGRGAQIRGKAIAVDVYERSIDGTGGRNLVRVEARRLRRLLHEFYEDHWDGSGVRIFVDSGGYKPRFSYEPADENIATDVPDLDTPHRRWRYPLSAGLAALAGLALIGMWFGWSSLGVQPKLPSTVQAERAALGNQSLTRLQAANLADQARGMFFPVFDVKRQQIALGMFRHATELDPALADGYSGSAQVLAALALLSPDAATREDLAAQASKMSAIALDLSPTDAWANAANGWVLAVSGRADEALRYARLASDLAPVDGHVLDLVGITAIVADAPELAADVSNPERSRIGSGRFGARNIWGVSQLMLGNYQEVVDAFAGAPAAGAPVSAPSLLFQAVALDQMGAADKAQQLMAEMRRTWPQFPSEFLADRIFRHDDKTRDMIRETLIRY